MEKTPQPDINSLLAEDVKSYEVNNIDTDSGDSDTTGNDERTRISSITSRQKSLHYPVMESSTHTSGVQPCSVELSDYQQDQYYMDQVPSLEDDHNSQYGQNTKGIKYPGTMSAGTTDDWGSTKPHSRGNTVERESHKDKHKQRERKHRSRKGERHISQTTDPNMMKLIETLVAKKFQENRTSTHREYYDCVVIYNRKDYEQVKQFVSELRQIAGKWLSDLGGEFKIELYDSEGAFSMSMVQSPRDVADRCSLILVYLTSNFGSSNNLEFFIEEVIAMQRFVRSSDRKPCQIRPVHTKPNSKRDYKTPSGLISTPGIEWFDKHSSFTRDKIVAALKEAMKTRLKLEKEQNLAQDVRMMESGNLFPGMSVIGHLGKPPVTSTRQHLLSGSTQTAGHSMEYNRHPYPNQHVGQMSSYQQQPGMMMHAQGMPTLGTVAPTMISTQPGYTNALLSGQNTSGAAMLGHSNGYQAPIGQPRSSPSTRPHGFTRSSQHTQQHYSQIDPRMTTPYGNRQMPLRQDMAMHSQQQHYQHQHHYVNERQQHQQQHVHPRVPMIDQTNGGYYQSQFHQNTAPTRQEHEAYMGNLQQMMSNTRLGPAPSSDPNSSGPIYPPSLSDLNLDYLPSHRSIDAAPPSPDGHSTATQRDITVSERHISELTTNDVEIDNPESINQAPSKDLTKTTKAHVDNLGDPDADPDANSDDGDDEGTDDDDADDDDGKNELLGLFKGKPDGSVVNIIGSQIVQIGSNNRVIGQIQQQGSTKTIGSDEESDDCSDRNSDSSENVSSQETRKPKNKPKLNIHIHNRARVNNDSEASFDDLKSVETENSNTEEPEILEQTVFKNNFDDDDDDDVINDVTTIHPQSEALREPFGSESNEFNTRRNRNSGSNTPVCDNLPSKDPNNAGDRTMASFHGPQTRNFLTNTLLCGNIPNFDNMGSFGSINDNTDELD